MDKTEVIACMAQLARPETQADEAERVMMRLDDDSLGAVPWVYQWLHDADGELEVHAAARVLGRWLQLPLARALAPALRVMLREPDVSDLSKLAAAALLERMGDPVDDADLQSSLQDVTRLAVRTLGAALAATNSGAAAVHVIETVGAMSAEARLALVDDLVRLGDARAAIVLGPLTNDPDGHVAVAAVAGIDLLRLYHCGEHLALAAENHPDRGVRDQAAITRERLAPTAPRPTTAAVRGRLGSPAGSGADVAMIASARTAAAATPTWDLLTVVAAARDGVREYAVAEGLGDDDIDAVVEKFASGGVELVSVEPREIEAVLRDASARSLSVGGGGRLGYLVWPFLLDGAIGRA